jgi:hypothetical protein
MNRKKILVCFLRSKLPVYLANKGLQKERDKDSDSADSFSNEFSLLKVRIHWKNSIALRIKLFVSG